MQDIQLKITVLLKTLYMQCAFHIHFISVAIKPILIALCVERLGTVYLSNLQCRG